MDKTIAIDNRYLIAEKIKDGGFGVIHKGYDLKFDKNVVAIKEIHHYYSKDQKFIDMFQDEAITTAKLHHPNIVTVYDLRVTADKRFYIIMEYIEGIDIRTLIHRCQAKGTCIPVELCVYIMGDVCKALDHAHNKKDPVSAEPLNIIHRDISPSNIMVTVDGVVKVIDFGIAKARYRRSEETEFGIMKGKVNYMSPEQIHGGHQDNRSDLFSLGIVMFEVLTGEKLFWDDSDLALLNKVAEAKIDPTLFEKHQIPLELRKIILKAVQKQPEDRFQSAREMYKDIYSFLQKVSTTDVSYLLSEFVREYHAEEQQRKKDISKDKIKIGEGTEIIKTHSISSDLAKKELQTAEKEPPPMPRDDETIVIKKERTQRDEAVVKKPVTKPVEPGKRSPILPRPVIPKKDYTRELKIAAIVLISALALFLILAIVIPVTSIGKSIHYALFRIAWEIKTVPPGASVILNGDALPGKTPIKLKLKKGDYPIQLRRAGFGPIDARINIAPGQNRMTEYAFEVILSLNSEPTGATVFFDDSEYPVPTPCEVSRKATETVRISMERRNFSPIDGFIFQGIEQDPAVIDSRMWKFEGLPGSPAKLAITGNFRRNFKGSSFELKKINAIHLKKASKQGLLKEGDILIKIACGADFSAGGQPGWFQRKDLPNTFYWQEAGANGEYKILYIGPIEQQLVTNPDQIIQQYQLNNWNMGMKYLVLEKFDLIENNPVMTVVSVSH